MRCGHHKRLAGPGKPGAGQTCFVGQDQVPGAPGLSGTPRRENAETALVPLHVSTADRLRRSLRLTLVMVTHDSTVTRTPFRFLLLSSGARGISCRDRDVRIIEGT